MLIIGFAVHYLNKVYYKKLLVTVLKKLQLDYYLYSVFYQVLQQVWTEKPKEDDRIGDLCVDGRRILKLM
jgi:hypothetical protein